MGIMASLQGLLTKMKELQETQAASTSDEEGNPPNGMMNQRRKDSAKDAGIKNDPESKASKKSDSKAKPEWAAKKKNAFWKAIAITSVNQKKDEKEGEITNLKQSL